MSVGKRDYYLSRLQTLLVFLILNGMAKRQLAILSLLCFGEIVKNSNNFRDCYDILRYSFIRYESDDKNFDKSI